MARPPPPPLLDAPLPLKVAFAKHSQSQVQPEKPRMRHTSGNAHRLAATMLPLARCSSTPSQPNTSASSSASSSSSGSVNCRAVVHERAVERNSSCIFGRSNPFETDFSVRELVAEGGFGKIFKCKSTADGRWYAVKLEQFWFKPQAYFNPADVRETLMKEALVLARLDHENVCRYFNTWVFGSLVSVDKLRATAANKRGGSDDNGDASGDDSDERSSDDGAGGSDDSDERSSDDGAGGSDDASRSSAAQRRLSSVGGVTAANPRSAARRSSSTYSSSSDWDGQDDDDLLCASPLAFDYNVGGDDDGGAVDFSDLGFDMQHDEADSDAAASTAVAAAPPQPQTISSPIESAVRTPSPPRHARRRLLSLESPHASVGPVCTQIDVYIQMALYEGNSLQFWLDKREAVDAREATRIFLQIVAGLKYIHSEGLVHRDIKPANIFLTKGSCVKIGDFGLAKNTVESSLRIPASQYFFDTLDTGSNSNGNSSSGGSVSSAGDGRSDARITSGINGFDSMATCSAGVGTPMYSSPEQIRGSAECDASTDVYSLGVLLCELFSIFSTQMERVVVLTEARKGNVPPAIVAQHPDVASLIQRMLQEDRAKRPSCAEIERSELFHRLCIETQKRQFGSAHANGGGSTDGSSSSSSSSGVRSWQSAESPPSSPRGGHTVHTLAPSAASPMQIRSASHSTTVSLFSTASTATSKVPAELASSDCKTVRRLLHEIIKLEDEEDAVLTQFSAGHGAVVAATLVDRAKSLQRERRTRLASALEVLAGSSSK